MKATQDLKVVNVNDKNLKIKRVWTRQIPTARFSQIFQHYSRQIKSLKNKRIKLKSKSLMVTMVGKHLINLRHRTH